MNISLTMQFDSLSELQGFLSVNPGATDVKVASAQPSNVTTIAAATPAVVDPLATPAPASVPAVDPLSAAPPVVDLTALRASLMARLRALAESMDDASELGKFINAFGVARFSELGDERLGEFYTALSAKYPA